MKPKDQSIEARKLVDRLVPGAEHGPLEGLLATTYELQPDFFDTDFLPSVLGLGAWDDRSRTSQVALIGKLAELVSASVLMEATRYHGRPSHIHINLRPVGLPQGRLHAKVLLLVHREAVRLFVGSANLTQPGYRTNREVAAWIEAGPKQIESASLLLSAIDGLDEVLGRWLDRSDRQVLQDAGDKLRTWRAARLVRADRPEDAFLWSGAGRPLWRSFLERWPADEPVERIAIVSPFWSKGHAASTLGTFLGELRRRECLASGAQVELYCSGFAATQHGLVPLLPADHWRFDLTALGATGTARAVRLVPDSGEAPDIEDYQGVRPLHAKVVLLTGKSSSLAYLGSANFTLRGWGFGLPHVVPNVEAGVALLRQGKDRESLTALLPPFEGEKLTIGPSASKAVAEYEIEVKEEDAPCWPMFLREARLEPCSPGTQDLRLVLVTEPDKQPASWAVSVGGDGGPDTLLLEASGKSALVEHAVALDEDLRRRLLAQKQVLVAWPAALAPVAFPVNLSEEGRLELPLGELRDDLSEASLLDYFRGRISWEEAVAGSEEERSPLGLQPMTESEVDKSRIQSYQVREFVEALPGVRAVLADSRLIASRMRIALLGPLSPLALSRKALEAVKTGRRTAVAGAFEVVELMACVREVLQAADQVDAGKVWREHAQEALRQLERLLAEIQGGRAEFGGRSAFRRYQNMVASLRRDEEVGS